MYDVKEGWKKAKLSKLNQSSKNNSISSDILQKYGLFPFPQGASCLSGQNILSFYKTTLAHFTPGQFGVFSKQKYTTVSTICKKYKVSILYSINRSDISKFLLYTMFFTISYEYKKYLQNCTVLKFYNFHAKRSCRIF